MLDFYRVSDVVEDHTLIADVDYLGSLSLEQHKQLQCVFEHPQGVNIHPFEDTRLYTDQVAQLLAVCQECLLRASNQSRESTYQKMLYILEQAVANDAGLVAFCD